MQTPENPSKPNHSLSGGRRGAPLLGVIALCGALTLVGCGGGGGGETTAAPDGNGDSSNPGGSTGTPVPAAAPAITTPPQAQSVQAGASATFSAAASGTAPLSYQWLRNGIAIAGATASSYTTAALQVADSGATFSVKVSNAAGEVTSSAAVLTVAAAPVSASGEGTRSLWLAATHTLALRSDGLLMGWGRNSSGQLGGGAAIAGSAAVQIATGVASASANALFGLALDRNGSLTGWGAESRAWLGGSTDTTYTTPQAVTWPARAVRQVEAGWQPYDRDVAFTFALLSDGTVWHLPGGREVSGSTVTDSPGQVADLRDVAALAHGHGGAYVVRVDGSVWRINVVRSTAFGPGWTFGRAEAVAGLANVRQVACGSNHCLALRADGTLRAWGEGRSGELGQGIAASSEAPVTVGTLTDVTHIAVTSNYGASLARTRDGRVYSWGSGEMSARPAVRAGALTLPPADAVAPVEVSSLAGSTEVACSENHCAARMADGSVRAWGSNLYGQLGTNALSPQEPVPVSGVNLNVPGGTAGIITP